jgi:hypothetical protein
MSVAIAAVVLPLWAVVSQWVLLLALGFFLVVAYRQLGYMLRLKDIGSERDGLPIGEKAPAFGYVPFNDGARSDDSFDPQGSWTLLLFADPGCESCQIAVSSLNRQLVRDMRVLVITAVEPEVIAVVEQFRDASVPIGHVGREVPVELYHTLTTPFAYVIDPEGVIRAKGIASDGGSIRKLIQKADRHSAVRVVTSLS